MFLQFARAKPLQACKLAAIVATLFFSTIVFFGLLSEAGITSLFLVPVLGLALALVVAAETVLAGYRSARTGDPLTDLFAERPMYTIARAAEIVLAAVSTGALVFVVATLPEGPMAGPGAIGLFFIMIGLALLVLGGSLVRTLTEYYYYRRDHAA